MNTNSLPRQFPRAEIARRLRTARQARRMTLRQTASLAGLSPGFLSQVEAGKTSPSLGSFLNILNAFGMDVAGFFGGTAAREEAPSVVFRSSTMRRLKDRTKSWTYALPSDPKFRGELTWEEWKPGSRLKEWAQHPHDLCGWVVRGRITFEMDGGQTETAGAGDAFYLPAGRNHRVSNKAKQSAFLVCFMIKGESE